MPIYEYQCPQCQAVFEEWLSVSEATAVAPCPQCNTESSRIISNTAFVLKGGGWYVTEYGNRKSTNTGAASAASTSDASTTTSSAPSAPQTTTSTASQSASASA